MSGAESLLLLKARKSLLWRKVGWSRSVWEMQGVSPVWIVLRLVLHIHMLRFRKMRRLHRDNGQLRKWLPLFMVTSGS